ncbi:hypothetical protein G9A89_005294 [Geosiphon pyriformis]|nr:hypothetical protein G9A89_005294 [Geosiphon pyriformis]
MRALMLCNLFLSSTFPNVFHVRTGVPILDVLGLDGYLNVVKSLKFYGLVFTAQMLDHHGMCFSWYAFHKWKRLNLRGPVPVWFMSLANFVESGVLGRALMSHSTQVNSFCDVGFVAERLITSGSNSVEVYTDSSVKGFGFVNVCGGAAAYFPDADISIDMHVHDLLSLTLVELHAIALALECVPVFSVVILLTDSQALLIMCDFSSSASNPNFHYKCWIKREHICHFISSKKLSVTWRKVKGYSGVVGNE